MKSLRSVLVSSLSVSMVLGASFSIVASLYINQRINSDTKLKNIDAVHKYVASMLQTSLAISDFGDVQRILGLISDDQRRFGVHLRSGEWLLSDYAFQVLFEKTLSGRSDRNLCGDVDQITAASYCSSINDSSVIVSIATKDASLMQLLKPNVWVIGIAIIPLLLVGFLGARVLQSTILKPFLRIHSELVDLKVHNFTAETKVFIAQNREFTELDNIATAVNELILKIEAAHNELQKRDHAILLSQLTKQLAHDIRSPLSALNMISSSLSELSEDKRLLVRIATQRINDIANNLLLKSREAGGRPDNEPLPKTSNILLEVTMITSILDSIVSETRAKLGERSNLEIQTHLEDGYGLFAMIDPSEFARVISNLLNNSIEAIPEAGRIKVEIRGYENSILVSIIDNGRGMSKEVLKRIGEKGLTFGKEGTRSGSGLGLYHAKQTVESAKGSIEFESQLDQGTMVTIKLPRAMAPEWFVEELQLPCGSTLVSIDDDESIHQIWAKRLSDLEDVSPNIKHLTFTSTCEFEAWLSANKRDQVQYLVDYEFLGKNENGLDLIESTGIQGNSILVTSRFEEAEVCKRAKALGVQIIPKGFAPCVPIVIS